MVPATAFSRRAFSLIELVIVVVIIGIIAAIAIPRMSRGATGANDSALSSNLAMLRKAVDLYQAEHNGSFPTVAAFPDQLTRYSNEAGDNFVDTKDATHPFGPYLRNIPVQSVGPGKGKAVIGIPGDAGDATKGWLYDAANGKITCNATTEADAAGKTYVTY